MPFPLAHPAAILPFRRWGTERLSFVALVLGSLTPDLANCLNYDKIAHSLIGSVIFCWPFGLISLWIFHLVRAPLVATLPTPHREVLLPLCGKSRHSVFICAVSLLLGIWIHLGWDLFTHDASWLAEGLGSLSISLPKNGIHQIRVSRVLWGLSTVGGAALVITAYFSWLKLAKTRMNLHVSTIWRCYATWLLFILIPCVVATLLTFLLYWNHSVVFLVRAFAEIYFTLLYLTLGIAGIALIVRSRHANRVFDTDT
jgi:hypothetical protein